MARGGGSRKRPVKRRQSSRGWLFATLALPVLGLVAFFGWALREGHVSLPDSGGEAVTAAPAAMAPVEAPTDWSSVLASAGVERARIARDGNDLVVETLATPNELEASLRDSFSGEVERDGNSILLTDSSGGSIAVHVQILRTEDSGIGLVEADEVDAVPAPRETGPGRIVLILDDVGFDRQPLGRAAELDPDIAFAIIPAASRAREASDWLQNRGFELLCHLPMEPMGYPRVKVDSPAVLTTMSDDAIRTVTREALSSLPGVRGLNNHMGSRASADARVMRAILEVVQEQGLYFVDSRTSSSSVGASTARELGVRSASRQVFLDDDPSAPAVRRQLRELARIARTDGLAIGIGHVLPSTIAVLEDEVPRLRSEGIDFVRPSTVVR